MAKSFRPPWWAQWIHTPWAPDPGLKGSCWQGLGMGAVTPPTTTPSLSQALLQVCSPLLSGSCRQACRKQGP